MFGCNVYEQNHQIDFLLFWKENFIKFKINTLTCEKYMYVNLSLFPYLFYWRLFNIHWNSFYIVCNLCVKIWYFKHKIKIFYRALLNLLQYKSQKNQIFGLLIPNLRNRRLEKVFNSIPPKAREIMNFLI